MMSVGDIMSKLGVFSTLGDIMSTPEDVQYTGGYNEYTRVYHDECGGLS